MNEQAFVMTSDQRRCMQRSRFVCRILNFCVKKPCSRGHFVLARKGRRIYGGEPNEQAVKQIVNVGKDCEAIVFTR